MKGCLSGASLATFMIAYASVTFSSLGMAEFSIGWMLAAIWLKLAEMSWK